MQQLRAALRYLVLGICEPPAQCSLAPSTCTQRSGFCLARSTLDVLPGPRVVGRGHRCRDGLLGIVACSKAIRTLCLLCLWSGGGGGEFARGAASPPPSGHAAAGNNKREEETCRRRGHMERGNHHATETTQTHIGTYLPWLFQSGAMCWE